MSKSTTLQEEPKPHFRVGSTYFFSGYPDFHSNDIDEVEFEEHPKLYQNVMQFRKKDKSRCLFKWRKMSADEFVAYSLNSKLPMEVGKFLVPSVAEHLNFTLEHLKMLEPVFAKMDEKHQYERIIFDAYISNGAFTLTDEQRRKAYQSYKLSREK